MGEYEKEPEILSWSNYVAWMARSGVVYSGHSQLEELRTDTRPRFIRKYWL